MGTERPLITSNYAHLLVPGVQVQVEPEEALKWGAFEEDALSEEDAWDANADGEAEN